MIPFYLARADSVLSPVAKHLDRRVADYFLQNFYVTPSGLFTVEPLLLTLQVVGADRIMYSVDYPYAPCDQARAYLENAPISPADKAKTAHLNAENLLKLYRSNTSVPSSSAARSQ
jgi:predicted TIM-barrel fold metal-dependent hydrolase